MKLFELHVLKRIFTTILFLILTFNKMWTEVNDIKKTNEFENLIYQLRENLLNSKAGRNTLWKYFVRNRENTNTVNVLGKRKYSRLKYLKVTNIILSDKSHLIKCIVDEEYFDETKKVSASHHVYFIIEKVDQKYLIKETDMQNNEIIYVVLISLMLLFLFLYAVIRFFKSYRIILLKNDE